MKYDSIIFDIDGTIWDVRREVADSWAEAIRQNTDWPVVFDAERLGHLFGKPMNEIFQILYPDVRTEEMDAMIPVLYEFEHRFLRERKPAPYAGVEETVAALAEKLPLYIVTNAQTGYVEAMLEATGLGKYFQGWLCYGDTLQPKNVTIERLAAQYGLEAPVYVGDTQGDADACKAAGVPFIFAAYGLGQADAALAVIGDIRELPGVIGA